MAESSQPTATHCESTHQPHNTPHAPRSQCTQVMRPRFCGVIMLGFRPPIGLTSVAVRTLSKCAYRGPNDSAPHAIGCLTGEHPLHQIGCGRSLVAARPGPGGYRADPRSQHTPSATPPGCGRRSAPARRSARRAPAGYRRCRIRRCARHESVSQPSVTHRPRRQRTPPPLEVARSNHRQQPADLLHRKSLCGHRGYGRRPPFWVV